ncbi:MAG: RluA family pseudouridine synthase, partial [Actinobacteria bacterium]|nr:RluA family pseudouridine synthase [Actinomycetota bacterium]
MQTGNDNSRLLIVDKDSSGIRVDIYLSARFKNLSRNYIQKLIKTGNVLINNCKISKNEIIVQNDSITIRNLNASLDPGKIDPMKMDLDICYEDKYFLVISKPANLTVHPAPGNYTGTLVNAVMHYLNNCIDIFPDPVRPGIVHRLDKDTSGLIIIAKTRQSHEKMSDLFKTRTVKKTYNALVYGAFKENKGKISLPLGRSRTDRQKISVSADFGRNAETLFEVIEEFGKCTLLNVFPLTGRTHQIRVHFSFIGHPVLGDKKYGNVLSDAISQAIGLKRHFLHASRLEFTHPFTCKKIDIAG